MKKIEIHIPSYRRPNSCLTAHLLNKIGIYKDEIYVHVCNDDFEGYKQAIGDISIVLPFPFHKKTDHLNYILENADFKNKLILTIDDDIKRFCKFNEPTEEKQFGSIDNITTREEFIDMLEYCDGIAEERGLIAWGLVPSTNKLTLLSKAKHGPADYSNVSGALCCYRSKTVKFKTDSVLEDMQYCLDCIDNGYNIAYIDKYCYENIVGTNKGGYQDILACSERGKQLEELHRDMAKKHTFIEYKPAQDGKPWKKRWFTKKVNEYMQANGIKKKFVKTDGTDEERDSEGAFRPFLI